MTQNTFSDTANIGEDFIQHHGVKGMKWGVRKDRDAPKTGGTASKPAPKTGGTASKPAPSKTKYNTFEIVNEYPDGTREVYVGGVGSPGRFLTEEEQEEADILAGELEETRNEYNKMFDGFVEMLNKDGDYESDPKLSSSEKEVIRKRQGEYEQKATVAAERYEVKLNRWTTLSNKARKLEGEHYKNNPNERRRPAYMPTPGKTTVQTKPDKAGPNEARIREDWLKKSTKHMDVDDFLQHYDVKMEVKPRKLGHSDLSELGSDFLMHHGVKGMKWGVRKDGKPRGYQGPSSTKKKVKKAIANVVDPDKRAKSKLKKAKAKYERQRLNEQASGYEKATKESEKNSSKNEQSSDPKPKSKPVAELSDDELRKVIQRIDLEKRYATLMEERRPKSRTEKVNKFLKKAATEAAENAAKQLITKGVGAAVTRATGVPVNGANTKAATNALKTAANDATKDVTEAAQKQAAAQPKAPSQPTPKASTPTSPTKVPSAPRAPQTREPLPPIESKNVYNMASPTKSPSFSDILSKSYNDTITSGTTQRGTSWLDEFDTNRDFVTLNQERRKRR